MITERGRPYAGIHCPECGSKESYVIDSRNDEVKQTRRRRHLCNFCHYRYTTYEVSAAEYKRIQATKVNKRKFDSVINFLQVIKTQFGETNGYRQD